MRRVLATEAAELVEFKPLSRLLLVLRGAVVPPLAVTARQMNDVSHGPTRMVGGGWWLVAGARFCVHHDPPPTIHDPAVIPKSR
jgi:hypothetical protein